jgi:hypothetical protein
MSQAQIYDDSTLLRRAYAAYYRKGPVMDQPSSSGSCVEHHKGKVYVTLRNVRGVLAVYRVRNDGILKGLKRYPKAFDTE